MEFLLPIAVCGAIVGSLAYLVADLLAERKSMSSEYQSRDLLLYEVEILRGLESEGLFPESLELVQEEFDQDGNRYHGYANYSTVKAHYWLVAALSGAWEAHRYFEEVEERLDGTNSELGQVIAVLEPVNQTRRAA